LNIRKNIGDRINYNFKNNDFINKKNFLSKNFEFNSNETILKPSLISKIIHDKNDYKYLLVYNRIPKILLIDDQKFVRSSLGNILNLILKEKKLKWDIIEGADGIDLLNYVIEDNKNNKMIKLIFTDENMEYINGTKAIEIIRYLEKGNKILKNNNILISTSEQDDKELKTFYKSIGVNFIFSKPCDKDSLLNIPEKMSIL